MSAYAHMDHRNDYVAASRFDAEQILTRYSTPAQKRVTAGTALISSSIMLGYEDLVMGLGGNPAALLRSVGIDPSLSQNPFEQIEFASFALLLERSAQVLNTPDFGIRLGQLQSGLVVMGPVGLALERVDTIRDMFRYCSKLMHIYSTGIQIDLDQSYGNETLLTFEFLASGTPLRRQLVEQLMLIGHSSAIDLSSGRARAKEIWFTHAPLASAAVYNEAFSAKVRFSESCAAAIFKTSDIDANVRTSDPGMFEAMLDSLSCHMNGRSNFSEQVKRDVTRWINEDVSCSREEVAERLGLHPRTLQRRLHSEGQTFELVKDEVRRELAQHLLLQSQMPLTEVAARLGFAEPAVLTRACRRWFALTPREMRRSAS